MYRYRVIVYWDDYFQGGVGVFDEPDSQRLRNKLLSKKGGFLEFTTEDGTLIRVRKKLINALYISPED